MSQYAVVTAIGEDRPGLGDSVSSLILEASCNIEDSRMAILGGEFAMLILISGKSSAIEKLEAGTLGLGERVGLTVQLRRTRATGESIKAGALPFEINAYSLDHPGIVQRLAHCLAERKINIRALDTHVRNAPESGQPLFSLHALVDVPAGESVAELRKTLVALGSEENIDFELRQAEETRGWGR